MSFSLTKDEAQELAILITRLETAKDEISSAVQSYNEAIEPLRIPVEEAVTAYNSILEEARALVTGITEKAESAFGDKSEKWQDGDQGQEVREWIDSWDGIELDDVDYQWPDDLSIDLPTYDTDLRDLPTEPG